MGARGRGSEWADHVAGEPELIPWAHTRRSLRGEAASLLAEDPLSPAVREAPGSGQSTLPTASPGIFPGSLFCQNIIKNFLGKVTREQVYYMIFHPEAWEKVVARSGLDRDEADMLYHILMKELIRWKEVSMPGDLSQEEKMFLLFFPLQKRKLEKSIEGLRAIADQVDATHKMLTKTNLVASTSGTISGVLNLLGLALSPVTGGTSLMLSTAGMGLGVAAAATSVLTSFLETNNNSTAQKRASEVIPMETSAVYNALEGISIPQIGAALTCVDRCVKAVQHVKGLRANQMAKANSGFMAKVKNFIATGPVPFWRAGGQQTAVEASALTMTRGAWLLGAAGAGLLLMNDVKSLLESWKHLEDGTRAEAAEELRSATRQLEQELRQLNERYTQTLWGGAGRRAGRQSRSTADPAARDTQCPRVGSESTTSASPSMSRRPREPSRRSQLGHREVDQSPVRLAKIRENQEEFLQLCRRDQERMKVISVRTHPEMSPHSSHLHF
ncbi:apolipoprotein L5 [Enhydra lutris kenyoni]|uniref:Apolipoprotein L5 n=1 Tax=Enhydra lutris kenyoni TaxID=391180 RepID=A0A2Y9KMG8_ENHLU|nr:apolipoprotein L5 [Enhydra lutris kenyoni]